MYCSKIWNYQHDKYIKTIVRRNLVAEEYQVDAVEGDRRRKELWKLKFWSRHLFVVLLVLAI